MNQQYGSYDDWGYEPTSEWQPQQPPQQPYDPYQQPPQEPKGGGGGGGGNSGLVIGVIGVIAALIIVAGVGVVLFMRDDDDDVEARETAVVNDARRDRDRTSEEAPPSTETATETATVTETRTQAAPAPAPAPGSGGSDRYTAGAGRYGVGLNTYRSCGSVGGTSWVGTGHSTTTCGFAENVARELAYEDISAAPLTVSAYSPTTQENISMTCRRAQDSELDPVFKCEGGRNAVVYVYPN